MSLTNFLLELDYGKRNPEKKTKFGMLEKEDVIVVDVTYHKFLLSECYEEKILKRK